MPADEPQLDVSMLKAAQEEHESSTNGGSPHIKAKGLDRSGGDRPLTYSAPELGSDSPSVKTGDDKPSGTGSATAKRQQARTNPNRGSRGNKKAGSAKGKRKR